MEKRGYTIRIYWTQDMIDYLRRHFATTLNDELAGCLGCCQRTVTRKASELGLKKDPVWLSRIYNERRLLANIIHKRMGYPGCFKKGVRNSPATEFQPGHKESEEIKAKRIAGLKRNWRERKLRMAI